MYTPPDNESMRQRFEHKGRGVCGPAVIAVLERKSVETILGEWWKCGAAPHGYRGWASMTEMRHMLAHYGYEVVLRPGRKAKEFPDPATDMAVVRIQWLDGNGEEFRHWMKATLNTHWVLMQKIKNEWWIFCNAEKWMMRDHPVSQNYLKYGYVSSYLEVD